MTFAIWMWSYVGAKFGANSDEIPIFLNHSVGKIDNLRARYDVTGITHEAFCRHLVAAI